MDNYIEGLYSKYTPIIQKLIDDNKKFYFFNSQIEWRFFTNEDKGLIATSENLELKVNIISVDSAYKMGEPLMIEFFILHEIRHIWQKRCVNLLNTGSCPNVLLAERYKSKEGYYNQQIEFEAFIFSYSVIRYKYGDVKYINYPSFYDEQNIGVEEHVNRWLHLFEMNNL